ncbi:Uncharacterised protein [Salmonella enterica subsp. enterica]|nr:Uncharacterised protein [Salmonella enterica subsp. enterica]
MPGAFWQTAIFMQRVQQPLFRRSRSSYSRAESLHPDKAQSFTNVRSPAFPIAAQRGGDRASRRQPSIVADTRLARGSFSQGHFQTTALYKNRPRYRAACDNLNWHRPQIFAYHHTTVTLALQRQNRKQIIYRIMDVSPLIRCFAIRYPPQTQQRHDMVNAQRAAVFAYWRAAGR